MPIIPNIPARLSGDGGLNPAIAKMPPIATPRAPDCSADTSSGLLNNCSKLLIS